MIRTTSNILYYRYIIVEPSMGEKIDLKSRYKVDTTIQGKQVAAGSSHLGVVVKVSLSRANSRQRSFGRCSFTGLSGGPEISTVLN